MEATDDPGMFEEMTDHSVTFVNSAGASTLDIAETGKDVKKLVRSQAMKNYHAKRREAAAAFNARRNSNPPLICSNRLNVWTPGPDFQIPIETNKETRELLHHMYTDPRLSLYREAHMRTDLENATKCPASFHQILSIISSGLKEFDADREVARLHWSKQELFHSTKAIQLVRQMMTEEKQLFNGELIIAVASLLTQARMNLDRNGTLMHMNALEHIVRLRGGVDKLPIAQQDCIFWVNINIATTWDIKPRFPPPLHERHYSLPDPYQGPLPEIAHQTKCVFQKRFPKLKPLSRTFEDVVRLSIYMVGHATEPTTTTHVLVNHLSLLCYRLVVTQYECSLIGEGLRLALLIFLITIWRQVRFTGGHQSTLPTTEQVRKLKIILEKLQKHKFDWEGLSHLRVFFVVMGYLEVNGEEEIRWWTQRWKNELQGWNGGSLECESSSVLDSVGRPLVSLLWVDYIHGQRYRDLGSRLGGVYAVVEGN